MKKTIALLLALVLCLSLCACGSGGFDAETALEVKVNSDAYNYCYLNYAEVKGVYADITTTTVDGNTYYVQGKITVNDSYNDKYEGKFDGTYVLENEEFIKQSLNIETPKKK